MKDRFVVDQRVGIIAICDTSHDSYQERTEGLHGDEDYVVKYWKGQPNDGSWELEEWQVNDAFMYCGVLNSYCLKDEKK